MDITLARALVTGVRQQKSAPPALHDVARELFTKHGARACDKHDLAWCSECWMGPSPVTSERTSTLPSYGYDTQGTALIDVDIRGWDTELIRGR